jgi:hypothetical protein
MLSHQSWVLPTRAAQGDEGGAPNCLVVYARSTKEAAVAVSGEYRVRSL